jgi:hypothetical protein
MKSIIKILVFSFIFASILSSCTNGDAKVREEAKNAIVNNTPNKPNQPTKPTPPKPVQPSVPTGPTTTIEFKETTYNFGEIKQGDKAEHTFTFTNTGKEPLILSNVKASCGCTVPKWPREPIAVGKSGVINVVFNSKGKRNAQNRKVTVTANTDPKNSYIYMKGNVKTPPGSDKTKKSSTKPTLKK